jgi:hypothetical protein
MNDRRREATITVTALVGVLIALALIGVWT